MPGLSLRWVGSQSKGPKQTNHIGHLQLMPATPMVQVSDLVKSYSPKSKVLDGISLEVAKGEVIGLIGPNGAGTSHNVHD